MAAQPNLSMASCYAVTSIHALPLHFARQVAAQRLEIQHHVGIIATCMADFINAENKL